MSSTYLELTNKVLRKLNEVELTSANFASATGFHALVKDSVNYAIDSINQDQYRWPFNHNTNEETLVAGTATYSLPATYKTIDWGTFLLKKDESLDQAPKVLPQMDYNEWNTTLRERDEDAPAGGTAAPDLIYRTRDGKFGVSPVPDEAYTVAYEYWANPTALSAHGDTTAIPSRYDRVIVSAAMSHCYDFRENYEMAGKEYQIYKQALKQMRAIEINDSYTYAYDTRSEQVRTSRSSLRWSR